MSFAVLGLSDELLRAVDDAGYSEPTPIQKGAIPPILMAIVQYYSGDSMEWLWRSGGVLGGYVAVYSSQSRELLHLWHASESGFFGDSTGDPVLARPFLNAISGLQDLFESLHFAFE